MAGNSQSKAASQASANKDPTQLPLEVVSLIEDWESKFDDPAAAKLEDDPNYYVSNPRSLFSTSTPTSFTIGTGHDIFNTILPTIERAHHEVIFVTCFWASSSSLSQLGQSLKVLSRRAIERGGAKIRVRIGLSSLSLWQKLFQTSKLEGYIYPPDSWKRKLSLPPPGELAGLDLEIKSIFVLPFSVMHPKFIIVDRRTVFLPSCNVSWEPWFEGCMTVTGPIVLQFVRFWEAFWARSEAERKAGLSLDFSDGNRPEELGRLEPEGFAAIHRPTGPACKTILISEAATPSASRSVPTVFLPSPHHRSPRFTLFPWSPFPTPPLTPLNAFMRTVLRAAKHTIFIQTPNLTSLPFLAALIDALKRGVDVTITTSKGVQVLEQIITAGTTTGRCVKYLVRKYKSIVQAHESLTRRKAHAISTMSSGESYRALTDLESGHS